MRHHGDCSVTTAPRAPAGATAKGHGMLSLDGRRIVLVDDDASMSHALERLLKLAGCVPVIFPSAEALLDACTEVDAAACLILDVHLPGLSGFELYDRLARMGNAPPVIFITAYDETESRVQAEAAGASAYLTKPFSGRDLVAATARAIQAHAAGRAAQ